MVSFIVGYHTESTDIHYCIGKQIVENTAVPRYRTGRNPYQKIPCMCDARVGQHSLYIILSQSDKITGDHRNDGYDRSEEQRLNSSHVAISYAVFCLKTK